MVIVDGKSPQTIPTMDTPPEAQKLPKCRLFFILTIILILSLVLLAGYCAWLFVLYETDVEQMEHSDESFMKNPTESPIEDAIHFSTSLPEADKDYLIKSVNTDLEGSFSEDEGGDFGFLGSSSSVESVYDSSLPYGSSETSVSLSLSWPEVYEYSYSDSSSLSVDDTTKKADQFLIPDRKGKLRSGGLKGFLDNLRNNGGRDTTVEDVLSYDVMSSYWIRHPIDDDVEESQSITAFDSDFTEWSDWVEPSDEGSGSWQEDDSWFSSDWPIDLFSETLSEVDSYVGSGDSYDIVDEYIPRPVDRPTITIDESPAERIEIAVCNWPKRLFDKEAQLFGSVKMAQYSNPSYDVTSLSTSNVFITQIRSEVDGVLTARIFMRDYSVSIVAVRELVKTPMSTFSSCYFSFLTPDLQEDAFGDDYSGDGDDEDEFEGSGAEFEDDLQELTLEIRNPVLLGSNLPIFSQPIAKICMHSTKYWATSIHIKP